MNRVWIDASDALLAVLLAPQCAACASPLSRPTRGPVCEACWTEVRCAPPAVSTTPTGSIDQWRAAGRYAGALRAIIHAFKYDGRRTLAVKLGTMMRTSGRDLLADADGVVPVPLHRWRRLIRGFNQAEDLAAHLERPIVHALRRKRATAPQTGLTAPARHRNVRDAFTLSWRLSRHARRTMLEDRIVVLIDDVRTTGATLEACAGVLKEAGAREVRALTLGLAE